MHLCMFVCVGGGCMLYHAPQHHHFMSDRHNCHRRHKKAGTRIPENRVWGLALQMVLGLQARAGLRGGWAIRKHVQGGAGLNSQTLGVRRLYVPYSPPIPLQYMHKSGVAHRDIKVCHRRRHKWLLLPPLMVACVESLAVSSRKWTHSLQAVHKPTSLALAALHSPPTCC